MPVIMANTSGYAHIMPMTSRSGASAIAPMITAARRQVLGMNMAYVKMSNSQNGIGGGM